MQSQPRTTRQKERRSDAAGMEETRSPIARLSLGAHSLQPLEATARRAVATIPASFNPIFGGWEDQLLFGAEVVIVGEKEPRSR